MYPGVPDVSWAFSGLQTLAIPKSVIRKYPSESITRFSGLMSLCIIYFSWQYSRPATRHATKKPIEIQTVSNNVTIKKWDYLQKLLKTLMWTISIKITSVLPHVGSSKNSYDTYGWCVHRTSCSGRCDSGDHHRLASPWPGTNSPDLKRRSTYWRERDCEAT